MSSPAKEHPKTVTWRKRSGQHSKTHLLDLEDETLTWCGLRVPDPLTAVSDRERCLHCEKHYQRSLSTRRYMAKVMKATNRTPLFFGEDPEQSQKNAVEPNSVPLINYRRVEDLDAANKYELHPSLSTEDLTDSLDKDRHLIPPKKVGSNDQPS